MATKTSQQSSLSPFSRLSRFGVGLGLRSQSSPNYTSTTQDQDEDDWYIAYNGPYEVPRDTRKRDSWGDIVEDEGRDAIVDADLIRRYGGGSKQSDSMGSAGSSRGRAQSATTATSSAIDPHRKSTRSPQRRSGNPKRAPVSSYINLDAAGGVGDSPMPPRRSPVFPPNATPTNANRTSMANFFFGKPSSSSKKLLRSPSTNNLVQHRGESRPTSSVTRKSTSLDMPRSRNQEPVLAIETKTSPTIEDEYYNSYYSTLVSTPKSPVAFGSRTNATGAKLLSPGSPEDVNSPDNHKHSPSAHPYTYTFPVKSEPESTPPAPPQSVPLIVTRSIASPMLQVKHNPKDSESSSSHRYPEQTHVGTKRPAGIPRLTDSLKAPLLSPLKSSVSAPNLRRGQLTQSPISPQLPTGMDRWFSAESWCDAVILPRPRFKVNNGPEDMSMDTEKRKGSGRIVSPPLTPIARSTDLGHDTDVVEKQSFPERREQIAKETGPRPRRRLTKSKSATSLRSAGMSNKSTPFPGPHITVSPIGHHRADSKGKGKLQKRRPKNLVLDDFALQVEPSLDRVLDEGDQLQEQREQWRAQATKSLGNKATRSLSRGRAKSLSHKDSGRHRKDPSNTMGNIDFLTARTLLGSQGVAPTIIVRTGSQGTKTDSSKSHSHSDSRATQSSQGAHRRNDSWGQHALKLAKYTASGALCGIQDQSQTGPMDMKAAAVEGAIRATDTKVIRLRDQCDPQEEEDFVLIDKTLFATNDVTPAAVSGPTEGVAVGPSGATGVSPTPSGTSGNEVGIALSTPPPSDDHSPETYESMSMPDHPYAHGARYPHHSHRPVGLDLAHEPFVRGSDFAGPHISSPKMAPPDFNTGANDVSIRHRLPPQATLQSLPHMAHPYAMGTYPLQNSGDLANQDGREPQAPDLEFDASDNHLAHAYARISTGNHETLGVGEALTSFRRRVNRDTGSGITENQSVVQDQPTSEAVDAKRPSLNSQTWPTRIRRKPVSYADYSADSSPASQGAQATSPSSEQLNAPKYQRDASVGNSSGSSPQHSPRPLGNVDDLEHFHDLFYRPDQPNPVAASPSTSRKVSSGASQEVFSLDVSSSRSIRSGLSSLARKLTEEYEDRVSQEVPSDIDSHAPTRGQRYGGLRGQRPSDTTSDHQFILSDSSKPRAGSPEPMDSALPLHLDNEETGPDDNVPENVGSSRASSILERESMDDDTFGIPVRLGAVEAVSTPPAVVPADQALRHLSFVADQVEVAEEAHDTEKDPQKEESQRARSQNSLAPPVVSADFTRSSYMTTTTDGSRMSGLSDFPEPPPVGHLTPAHMSIIHSYFGGDTAQKQIEDLLSNNQATTSVDHSHASQHMTFGGNEDIDSVGEAGPVNPDAIA